MFGYLASFISQEFTKPISSGNRVRSDGDDDDFVICNRNDKTNDGYEIDEWVSDDIENDYVICDEKDIDNYENYDNILESYVDDNDFMFVSPCKKNNYSDIFIEPKLLKVDENKLKSKTLNKSIGNKSSIDYDVNKLAKLPKKDRSFFPTSLSQPSSKLILRRVAVRD
ncbi:hypothetical protein ACDT12_13405, partial [Staphylococcus aureus]